MAETSTTSTTSATPMTPAEKAAKTREKNATKRSTSAKKAAETRAANRGAAARSTTARKATSTAARGRTNAAKKAAEATQETKSSIGRSVEMAEKAALVPVGAMLMARESVASTIDELRTKYSTRAKTKRELSKFERRGNSALKGVEKDLKSMIKDIEQRYEPVFKHAELMGARVENAVQGGRTAATQASTKVQERISTLV